MVETMYAASGVGLAANQVARTCRLLVIDTSGGRSAEDLVVACNPEILDEDGEDTDDEGCLSLPGIVAVIRRPWKVRVRYRDLDGDERIVEGEGLLARAWCHEVDHLDGRTILDRVSSLKRNILKKKIRSKVRAGEWG